MAYFLTFVGREDEVGGFRGATNQIAGWNVEACGYPIDCAKAGTLNSAFQIANKRAIKPSLQVEFHLRHAEFFTHCSHDFSKRLFYASARLNLFSTLGHLQTHRALLSATGQRVVTDNHRREQLRGEWS